MEPEIQATLSASAAAWITRIWALESVASTNDFLKDAARSGAPEGTVVVAEVSRATAQATSFSLASSRLPSISVAIR